MRIKELKLIPPSKRNSEVLIEFMKEHEKGLKAIKTLTEIKEIISSTLDCGEWIGQGDNKMEAILNKINEVEDGN